MQAQDSQNDQQVQNDQDRHALLADYPVVYRHKVTWGEMDAYQHVNNTQYFRYFENVRITHFATLGADRLFEEQQLGFIVGETRCRFKIPLTYPDTIQIGAKVTQLGTDRFVHVYCIVSEKLNAVVAEGDAKVVYYDYSRNSKTPFTESLLRQLQAEAV